MARRFFKDLFSCFIPQLKKKKKNQPAKIPVDDDVYILIEESLILEQSDAGQGNISQIEKTPEASQSLCADCVSKNEESLESGGNVFYSLKIGASPRSEPPHTDNDGEDLEFLTAKSAENPPEQEALPPVADYAENPPKQEALPPVAYYNEQPTGIPVVYNNPAVDFYDWNKIGRGGFGTVFKAKYEKTVYPVAIKITEIKKRCTEENKELQEVYMMQKVSGHRNTVEYYSSMIYATPESRQLWVRKYLS
ncbi:hypothetical protein XENTR_v10003702 [Xenopus tropicalis]|nr:hypothetical protein XENTR_v10003702 [Xenopus tropicalis]